MRDGATGSPSLSPRPGRNLGPVVRNEPHLGVSVLPPWGWPRCGRAGKRTRASDSMNHASQRTIPIATHDPRSPRAVVSIRPADLLRSVYVVGKTGTGKSTFLENLLLRSADAGFGAALIDPHGDLFSRVLENLPARHWNRVAILRPADAGRPVGVNLFGALAWGSRTLVASGVIEVFRTLWGPTLFGPRSEHVLRNAVLAVLENPNPNLLGLLRFLIDAPYRARALARITDPVVRIFWIKEFPSLGKQFASEVTAPFLTSWARSPRQLCAGSWGRQHREWISGNSWTTAEF